jgi:hypothetical protein
MGSFLYDRTMRLCAVIFQKYTKTIFLPLWKQNTAPWFSEQMSHQEQESGLCMKNERGTSI